MSVKPCKECGTEISKGAKACPKCGKDNRNFFAKHKVLTFILVVVVIIAVGATSGDNSTTTNTNKVQNVVNEEKFTLVSDKSTTDSLGTTYIEGKIKNNTDKEYSYVQVTFNLYDKDGAQLGTAMDNINNLEPNGIWKYKAMGLVTEKVASYKLVEITGW